MKKIPRNELRIVLRGFGVDTTKVVDISFIGKAVVVLTVDAAYSDALHARLREKRMKVLEDFDPTQPDKCLSYDNDRGGAAIQAVKRTVKRLCSDAQNAKDRRRPGLADYFLRQGAEVLARYKGHPVDAIPEEVVTLMRGHGTAGFLQSLEAYLDSPPRDGLPADSPPLDGLPVNRDTLPFVENLSPRNY
jgi:hypothetical protein